MHRESSLIFLISLCIALIVVAGCTSSTGPSVTPVTTTKSNSPFGEWTANFGGISCLMIISSDGTVQQWPALSPGDLRQAKWTKDAGGNFAFSNDMMVSNSSPLTYSADSDTITDNGGIVWTRVSTSEATVAPLPTKVPAAEILTKEGTCKSTGSLYIEGTIKSNVQKSLTVVIDGAGYDSDGVKLGSGFTYVDLDPYGTSHYKVLVLDGCPEDNSQGTYRVWIDRMN